MYKPDGRLDKITRNGEETNYTYDTNSKSRVNSISIANKNTQTFGFDAYDRVTGITETITANGTTKTYVSGKEYDLYGRISKETYPSGYYSTNAYDGYGNLKEVKDLNNRSVWRANTENALGQATSIYKGSKETTYGYDPVSHQITSIAAAGVVNYTYGYDSRNNPWWRKDNLMTTQQEDFNYDAQNRLTNWNIIRSGSTTYNSIGLDDATGNIISKSDIGYNLKYGGKNPNGSTTGRTDYSAIGPHALSTIAGVPASPFPQTDLAVTYTDFKKIKTLTEGNKYYELTYGVDDQRRMSEYKENGVTKLTRYYVGDYEEEVAENGNIRKIHYLSGAIYIDNSNYSDSLYYVYADNQGSILALTDDAGTVKRRYAYDPWGKRRDADNWNLADNGGNLIVNRGYTGHEHLDAFGIINMNGRVYDPYTAQFFSPDPALDGRDWLSYNRYGYCLGNPFKYTDPSGNNPFALAFLLGGFINAGSQLLSGNVHNVGQFFGAFAVGAFSGLMGASVGVATAAGITSKVGIGAVNGALAGAAGGATGGFIGGIGNSWLSGASFTDGLIAGFKGAGMGALGGGLIGGISNGIRVATHGGNFWTGDGAGNDFVDVSASGSNVQNNSRSINDQVLADNVNEQYGVKEGGFVKKITTQAPSGYTNTSDGKYFNPTTKQVVLGHTTYSYSLRGSVVYISRAVNAAYFNDLNYFRAVVGHELIHAYHNSLGLFNTKFSESVAYRYSYDVYNNAGNLPMAILYMNFAVSNGYWNYWVPKDYRIPSFINFINH